MEPNPLSLKNVLSLLYPPLLLSCWYPTLHLHYFCSPAGAKGMTCPVVFESTPLPRYFPKCNGLLSFADLTLPAASLVTSSLHPYFLAHHVYNRELLSVSLA